MTEIAAYGRMKGYGMYGLLLTALLQVAASPAAVAPPAEASPQVQQLRTDLERVIAGVGWPGAEWSVMVVSLDRGDTLFAHRADQALVPASNLKLFTSAAALYYLGPEYRYSTFLLGTGPIRNGVLDGDLVLYGTGDPTLSERYHERDITVWQQLADSLQALGVREVRGDIVGDASYFVGLPTGVGWQQDYMSAWYAAPASALAFNDNMVTLRVQPAEQAGWRPEIQLVPGGRGVSIVNQAATVASGRTRIQVDRAAYDGPIVVSGQIRRGDGDVWRSVPVGDPARYAAAMLHEVLEDRGIAVRGEVGSIQSPDASPVTGRSVFAPALSDRPSPRVLVTHRSPPLVEILKTVNKESHNLYAEQVLRTVGRVVHGTGSVEAGEAAVRAMIERETDREPEDLRMLDGSGLSVLNRASAASIIDLLALMADAPQWDAYWETLPEAGGGRGELRRMHQTAAAGNLRAKTGTIDRVSALSGYVRAQNRERLAFSIISNDVPSTWKAKRIEDRIGARIAAFDRPFTPRAPVETRPDPEADDRPTRAAAEPQDPTPPAERPTTERRTHTIRPGDTLEGIAREYGTTVSALREANPGVQDRRLIPGREIRLPD